MQQMVNIKEINQHLSRYIRSLESGNEIVITRHGLVAVDETKLLDSKQQEALKRLRNKIEDGYHLGGKGFNRESLYER